MIGFVLADGEGRYIRLDSGRYVEVTGKKYAMIWQDKEKALNVRKSSLSQRLRERFYVEEISIESEPPQKPMDLSGLIAREPEAQENVRTTASMIDQIIDIISSLDKRGGELNRELSNADKEITDIYHSIELDSFNAYQGWAYCKRLQTVLRHRRKIKNELNIISYIGRNQMSLNGIENLTKSINGMANRKYRTRIMEQEVETEDEQGSMA